MHEVVQLVSSASGFRVEITLKNKARMLAYDAHKVSLKVVVGSEIVAKILQLEVNLIHLAGRNHDHSDPGSPDRTIICHRW